MKVWILGSPLCSRGILEIDDVDLDEVEVRGVECVNGRDRARNHLRRDLAEAQDFAPRCYLDYESAVVAAKELLARRRFAAAQELSAIDGFDFTPRRPAR